MIFLASSREDIAGLEKAARRTGLQHLSADRASGVLVFTAGRTVLAFGEKVTARIREVAPGTLQVGRLRHRPIWGDVHSGTLEPQHNLIAVTAELLLRELS